MTDHSNDSSGKAWSGRFSEPVAELVKRYTASVPFDRRLAFHHIRGSLAHARMLARQGIIGKDDLAAIERGMAAVKLEIETEEFQWSLDDEDVHLNIEKRLTALVGDAGKRLHTGRSRNDQEATDIPLGLAADEKEFKAGNWFYDRAKDIYSNRLMKIGKDSALSGQIEPPPSEDDELRALTGLLR